MVLDSLFFVKEFSAEGSEIRASLELNELNTIFEGHFPGHPVVPGVCMMQAVKELAERHIGKKLTLVEADNMKFLSVLDPRTDRLIQATINIKEQDTSFAINATLFAGSVTFFKLKAVLNLSIAEE